MEGWREETMDGGINEWQMGGIRFGYVYVFFLTKIRIEFTLVFGSLFYVFSSTYAQKMCRG